MPHAWCCPYSAAMRITAFFPFFVIVLSISALQAQDNNRYHVVMENGEAIGEAFLPEIVIATEGPSGRSEIKMAEKRREDLRQLEYSVHKVYPYARRFAEILNGIDKELATLDKNSKKRKLIKEREEALFAAYESQVRSFNEQQGRVFVKMVYRQTGHTMYDIVKDKRTTIQAMFWQSMTQVWDIDLHSQYHPASNQWDWLMESYVRHLEQGGYNKVYRQANYVVQ